MYELKSNMLASEIKDRLAVAELNFNEAKQLFRLKKEYEGFVMLHTAIHHLARALLLSKKISCFVEDETLKLFGLHFLKTGILNRKEIGISLVFLAVNKEEDLRQLLKRESKRKLYHNACKFFKSARQYIYQYLRQLDKAAAIISLFLLPTFLICKEIEKIEVVPSTWTTTNSFTISWIPTNPNKILGYYYKLNAQVKYKFTYETKVSNIAVPKSGTNTFYIYPISIDGKVLGIYFAYLFYDGNAPAAKNSYRLELHDSLPTAPYPIDLATGDLNNDGHLDIVAASYEKGKIDVYLQRENITFAEPISYEAVKHTIFVDCGDLNNDGLDDVVASNAVEADCISIYFQKDDGSLTKQYIYKTDASPYGVLVCDINDDCANDILVSNLGAGTLGIFLQDVRFEPVTYKILETGQITQAIRISAGIFSNQKTLQAGVYPYSLAVADINNDGLKDVAVAVYTWDCVRVFFKKDKGLEFDIKDIYVGNKPTTVGCGDVDGDGNLEIIANALGENKICLIEYDASSDKLFATWTLSVGGAWGISCHDFNGDGVDEVVVTAPQGNCVNLFGWDKNIKNLKLLASCPSGGSSPWGLEICDLDRDGMAEIVVMNTGGRIGIVKVWPSPPTIRSLTHPDQEATYTQKTATMVWDEPFDINPIAGYYYVVDQKPDTLPTPKNSKFTEKTKVSIEIPHSGVWYFHLVAKDKLGNISKEALHYKLNIK